MYLSKSNAKAMRDLYQNRGLLYDLGDFIEESGVPLHYINAYFSAECEKIREDHMVGMARAFGMTVDQFHSFLIFHY